MDLLADSREVERDVDAGVFEDIGGPTPLCMSTYRLPIAPPAKIVSWLTLIVWQSAVELVAHSNRSQ